MDVSIPNLSTSNAILPSNSTDYIDNAAAPQTDNVLHATSSEEDYDTDVEDLVREMDVNYQRKVYPDSHLSTYEACQIIIKLSRRLNLDKSKMNILLHDIRTLLPNDNKLPRTIVGLMKILRQ